MVVVDASIALSWCFDDEASPATDAILERVRDDGAVVPALWYLEVANVLLQAERRGRITISDAATRLALIGQLPIVPDGDAASQAWHETLALARAENLSVYDASYLELSVRRRAPLATKDEALRRAAQNVEVMVLP